MKDKPFTVKYIDSLKGSRARQEISDPGCRHLYLVVQPSGTKSWAWRGRIAGDPKIIKRTLGPYPAFGLAAAREWAAARTQSVYFGIDPEAVAVAEKEAKQVAEKAAETRSIKTLGWYWDEH